MRRYTVWWLIGIAACALAVIVPATWQWLSEDRLKSSALDGMSKIEPDAEFVRTFVVEPDQYRRSIVGIVEPDWIGLTAAEFMDRFPDWELVSFSSQRIVVEERCTDLPTGGFIRLEGDAIVIFDGDPAGCHRRRETVDITPSEILQVGELEAGIRFIDSLELELILEGLHGP